MQRHGPTAGYHPSIQCFYPTRGKELVETPEWTFGLRAYYDTEWFSIGAQGKYVGDRWSTDVNDEKSPSYITVDLDARLKLDNMGFEGTYVQFNVRNVFDEEYLGSISAVSMPRSSTSIPVPACSTATLRPRPTNSARRGPSWSP